MDIKLGSYNVINSMLDSIDCPQKLDDIEQAKVDDSWFFRHSDLEPGFKISSTKSDPSNGQLTDKLSVVEEGTIAMKIATSASASETGVSESDCTENQSPLTSSPPCAAAAAASAASSVAAGPPRLATESRCQLRSKWENLRIQRERQHEQLRQQRKVSICRREQEQIQQLRAAAVPKAQPIRHYKPMRVHRSDKPLTVAKSPDFALNKRQRHWQQLHDQQPGE